jgi:hypothetical protein
MDVYMNGRLAPVTRPASDAAPVWPLPLMAGLLPAIGVALALALYADPSGAWCNPFVDDCVSISRMARSGHANQLFRALVLPGAVLQALTWLAAAWVLAKAGIPRRRVLALAITGVCAGLMLVVYGSFLGTDGDVYRWLRRWGTLIYFGGTYLAMLFFAAATVQLSQVHPKLLPRAHGQLMLALLAFIAVISLVHGFASLVPIDALEDRVENLTEWWGSLALTLMFVTMASIWRHLSVNVVVHLGAVELPEISNSTADRRRRPTRPEGYRHHREPDRAESPSMQPEVSASAVGSGHADLHMATGVR